MRRALFHEQVSGADTTFNAKTKPKDALHAAVSCSSRSAGLRRLCFCGLLSAGACIESCLVMSQMFKTV